MTQKFSVGQLDSSTRAYLNLVISAQGRRMPGIYHATSNSTPAVGLVFGLVILVFTLLVTFPPTEEPTQEAFLQTAGFLLGGWLITAAVRVWIAQAAGRRFGNFVYADSRSLYEVSGNQLEITNLEDIIEAKATQLQGDKGYAGTSIHIVMETGSRMLTINSYIPGKRMTVFLNALSYIRHGGEDGNDEKLKTLNLFERAGYARHIAINGEFPRSVTEVEQIETMEIPQVALNSSPGSESGFLGYVAIFVAAVLLFVSFRFYNKSVREDTIYARIMALPEKERPPALRMYLSHPEFNAHRDDANSKLETAYKRASETMITGQNIAFRNAMRELVSALAKKPQPVLSLTVEDETPGATGDIFDLKNTISTDLADKWGSTIGDELITFVRLDNPEIKSMIHLVIRRDNDNLIYKFTFRKGPDEDVFETIEGTYRAPLVLGALISQGFSNQMVTESCGMARIRQIPIDQDF